MEPLFDSHDINPTIRSLIRRKVRKLIRRPGFTENDASDIVQELMLHLLQHPFEYDENRGQITTVVSQIIDNKISHIIEGRYANKRDARRTTSLDKDIGAGMETHISGHEIHDMDTYLKRTGRASRTQEELADLAIDVARVLRCLPPEVARIARLLMYERKVDVARRLGMPWSTFCDHCRRLRAMLEEKKLQEYR